MEVPVRMMKLMIRVIFNLGGIIMRKLIYFGIAAIAAISLSSCQKEADFQDPSDNLVSVTFRAEKAGETRTAAVEGTTSVSYVWTDEDKDNFKLLQVTTDAENKEHFTEVPNPTLEFSSDMKVLTIKADVPEGSTLRAIVASEWTGSEGEDTRKPKVKSTQNPLADNFDPTADILVSEDEEIPEGETEIEGTFIFNRPVTVNKMTLKQMVEGEKVNKVVITSDENLIGYYNGSSMAGQTQGNVITLKYDDIAVGSAGEFPVYFITIPAQSNNLVVRVYTDKYSYMKSFGTVNFTNGKFSSFGLKLEGYGTPVVDTDFSGEWVITGNNNGLFAAKAFESGNSNLKALPVKMDISKKSIKATDVDIKMTFTKITEGDYNGFYTIQDANGLYLKAASKSGNQLKADEMTKPSADYYWKITNVGDGTNTIEAEKSENRNKMLFNPTSILFSCYSSGQNPVTIYPYSWVTLIEVPTITFTDPTTSVNVGESVTNVVTIDPSSLEVTYTSSNEGVATVDDNGTVNGIAAGSATITASFAGNDNYGAASASYEITVVSDQASTIAEVIAASDGANVKTTGVVAQKNQKGFILTDGNDNILVYQNAVPTVELGQAVTVAGTRGAYQSVAQITSPTITEGETGQTIPRTDLTVVTSANVTSFTTSVYVSLTGTLTISGNYYNISIAGSSTQGSLYQLAGNETFTAGKVSELNGKAITVYGYVTGRTNNYLNIAPVDIELDYSPALSISPATSSDSPAAWASGVGDAKSFTVTPTNGTWDYTSTDMDWATISQNGNVLTVTPKTAQATSANSGTITVTLTPSQSGYSSITETIYLAQAKYVSGTSQVTLHYTGSSTTNMTGGNDAAKLGLDADEWSVVGDKGSASNLPGLNKDGTIRLYYNASGSNTITVTSSVGTINSIIINYVSDKNNGKVFVDDNEVTASNGSYPINSTSFVIANGNTSNVQVHINYIEITYTPSN